MCTRFLGPTNPMKTTLNLNDARRPKPRRGSAAGYKPHAADRRGPLRSCPARNGIRAHFQAYRGKGGLPSELDVLSNKAMLDAADK
jgi:hypothetical protein